MVDDSKYRVALQWACQHTFKNTKRKKQLQNALQAVAIAGAGFEVSEARARALSSDKEIAQGERNPRVHRDQKSKLMLESFLRHSATFIVLELLSFVSQHSRPKTL